MNCKIECGQLSKNPLPLKKNGLPTDKKVKWFTNDKGVTYCLDIPGGIFLECPNGGVFQVQFGQSVELHLEAGAKVGKSAYGVRVCAGELPANCKNVVVAPPEIIVTDDKKKKTTVKKAAPKKKAK